MIKIILLLSIAINMLSSSGTRDMVRYTELKVEGTVVGKVEDFGTYHALLIYVQEYDNLQNLKTPKKDVQEIAQILKNRYGFKETTIVPNPKNSDDLIEILDALQRKLGEKDNLLIYYAGHGSKEGFWQLSSARQHSRVGWIPLEQAVNYTLRKIRAKHILVVADSCYAGVLTRESAGLSSLSTEDKRYYSKLNHLKSRNVLTGGGFQPVQDVDSINPKHSVFANGFLNMLKNNDKSIFAMDERYVKVKRYVQLNTQDQMPLYGDVRQTGHQDGGDFIFIDHTKLKQKKQEKAQKVETVPTVEPKSVVKKEKIVEKKEEKLYGLKIVPTPSDAKVQIMNIKPKYKEGLKLKKGRYKIRISKKGYAVKNMRIDLMRDTIKTVSLTKQQSSTFYDTHTGLMWQDEKYTPAEERVYYSNGNYGKVRDWSGAIKYCNALTFAGYTDWRLPTLKELQDLYTKKKQLENVTSDNYWSSSVYVGNTKTAWIVNFKGGYTDYYYKTYEYYVRCVRGRQ